MGGSRSLTRIERLLRGGLVTVASLVLVATPSLASPAGGPTCVLDEGTHIVTVSPRSALPTYEITRSGNDLLFGNDFCGTVHTVDRVNIDLSAHTARDVWITLEGGAFAPGYTDEGNGTSEIEFFITGGTDEALVFEGTDGPNTITAGSRFNQEFVLVQDLNLNPDQESSGADNDVTVLPSFDAILLLGRGGDDRFLATGTGSIGSRPTTAPFKFFDGAGSDTMAGGSGPDTWFPSHVVSPDPGDSFSGGGGTDTVDNVLRDQDVSITLDGAANDGIGCPSQYWCENDNVGIDVENILTYRGDDYLVGNGASNELDGGDGMNILQGMGGDDVLRTEIYVSDFEPVPRNVLIGGPGNDTLYGGAGIDLMYGEEGRDTASYLNTISGGVSVSLNGRADDGHSGETDNVGADIEDVIGTPFNDSIVGSRASNRLIGLGGDDRLTGGGGNDSLLPGAGVDMVAGGPGDDTAEFTDAGAAIVADLAAGTATGDGDDQLSDIERLTGSSFGDELLGDREANLLDGRLGRDTLAGRAGDDTLLGGLGNDSFNGGLGTDTCIQGPGSGPKTGCEG